MASRLTGHVDKLLKYVLFGSVAGVAGWGISQTMYVVPPGFRALKFKRFGGGLQPEEYAEGLHFLVPWFQRRILMDVRTQPHVLITDTGTKDLQNVRISIRVLWAPKVDRLHDIVTTLEATNYAENVFKSIGNEVLKAAVAQFDADELVTSREIVSQNIRSNMMARAAGYNLELKDISITNIEFSSEYSQAIEAKQVEQQRAEQQRYSVEISRQLTQARVIEVEGESHAARIISQAMAVSPDFLELKRIETAREVARILATSRNIVYLPGNTNVLMSLQ